MNSLACQMGYRDMLRLRKVFPRVLAHVEHEMSTVERRGVRRPDLDSLLAAVEELHIALEAVMRHPSAPEVLGCIVDAQKASTTEIDFPRDRAVSLKFAQDAFKNAVNPDHDDDPFPKGAA